jgi:hypothetical protein
MLAYAANRNVPGLAQHNEVRDDETDEEETTNDIAHLLRKARQPDKDEEVGDLDEDKEVGDPDEDKEVGDPNEQENQPVRRDSFPRRTPSDADRCRPYRLMTSRMKTGIVEMPMRTRPTPRLTTMASARATRVRIAMEPIQTRRNVPTPRPTTMAQTMLVKTRI